MKNSNLTIYQKYIDFFNYSYDLIRKYPKSETFTLVSEIKNELYKGFKFLVYAIKCYNVKDKLIYLNELDICLRIINFQIRVSYRYKFISCKNYETWSKHLTDVSNMLGGWIISCQKR